MKRTHSLTLLLSLTLFSSALLSFSVQPILGKMLLPLVGGSPAGWIVSLAFFQFALLAGYGFSYLFERTSPWVHGFALLALYAAGLFYLPPALAGINENGATGIMGIVVFKNLFHAIFIPFMALAATTSALQRLLSATDHPSAKDPYYLYVASNIGSFAGLLLYPLFWEVFFGLANQSTMWRAAYYTTMLLVAFSLWQSWRHRNRHFSMEQPAASTQLTARQILTWMALAFVPCSLSMGVTTLITTDVSGVPLLWILPLALYLLTFILAFSPRQFATIKRLHSQHLLGATFILILTLLGIRSIPSGDIVSFLFATFLVLEVFFTIAWLYHYKLASLRPAADRLSLYYLVIATGGCLAGILHVFILPVVLHDVIEFPVVILLSLLIHPDFYTRIARPAKWLIINAVLCLISGLVMIYAKNEDSIGDMVYIPSIVVFFLTFVMLSSKPRFLMAISVIILSFSLYAEKSQNILFKDRGFFGTYKVKESVRNNTKVRYFTHGNTSHGLALYETSDDQKYNVSYYSRIGPAGNVMRVLDVKSAGVIGLGAGVLACTKPGTIMDFYEIDDKVVNIARKYFPYLNECPAREIHVGDGRLEIKKSPYIYDMILLDAFTSDGIPVHTLTVEAISEYLSLTQPDGVLMFHVSNRTFDLSPKIAASARANGLNAYEVVHIPDQKAYPFVMASKWVAIPASEKIEKLIRALGWKQITPSAKPWTDDHSSLLSAVNLKYIAAP
jgi:hypothetical protein